MRHRKPLGIGDTGEKRWNAYKETLRKLYIGESKTREEVRQIMEQDHDFLATKGQYERHFKRWGWRKYLSKSDWNRVGAIQFRRARAGRQSIIYLDGKRLSDDKLRKEVLRNCSPNPEERWQRAETPPMPKGVIFKSPPFENQELRRGQGQILNLPYLSVQEHLQSCLAQLFNSPAMSQTFEVPPLNHTVPSMPHSQLFSDTQVEINLPRTFLEKIKSNLFQWLPNVLDGNGCNEIVRSKSWNCLDATPPSFPSSIDGLQTLNHGVLKTLSLLIFLISNKFDTKRANITRLMLELLEVTNGERLIRRLLESKKPSIEALSESLFREAVESENFKMLRVLLDLGVDPNEIFCRDDWSIISPLCAALLLDNLLIVELLIEHGANVDSDSNLYNSPLHFAISNFNIPAVRLLIDHGARLDVFSGEDSTFSAIQHAARVICVNYKNSTHPFETGVELIEVLLDAGANTAYVDKEGYNCIVSVIPQSRFSKLKPDVIGPSLRQIIHLLIQANASVNCRPVNRDNYGDFARASTALDMAANLGELELYSLLRRSGANISSETIAFAVKGGSIQLVESLIDGGSNIDTILWTQEYPLLLAIENKDVSMVKFLVAKGANVNPDVAYGGYRMLTPLQAACQNDHQEIIHLLLDAGARIVEPTSHTKFQDRYDTTALAAAAGNRNLEIVRMLLDRATIRGEDIVAHIPLALEEATIEEDQSMITLLLGHDDFGFDEFSNATLLQCAIETNNKELLHAMLRAGVPVDTILEKPGVHTPLVNAILGQNLEFVTMLLDAGADINNASAKNWGMTALCAAATINEFPLFQHLLDSGADPNDSWAMFETFEMDRNGLMAEALISACKSRYGKLPRDTAGMALQRAILVGNVAVFDALLAAGANVTVPAKKFYCEGHQDKIYNMKLRDNETALGTALRRANDTDMQTWVTKLLLKKADPNAAVDGGAVRRSGLVAAIETRSVNLVNLLFQHGANVNARARGRLTRTPLQAAVETGSRALVQLLLDKGANPNENPASDGGVTALQAASIGGFTAIASILLTRGADVNAPGAIRNGRTALEGAAEYGRIDMLQLLLDSGVKLRGQGFKQYEKALKLTRSKGHPTARKLLQSYYDRVSQSSHMGRTPALINVQEQQEVPSQGPAIDRNETTALRHGGGPQSQPSIVDDVQIDEAILDGLDRHSPCLEDCDDFHDAGKDAHLAPNHTEIHMNNSMSVDTVEWMTKDSYNPSDWLNMDFLSDSAFDSSFDISTAFDGMDVQ